MNFIYYDSILYETTCKEWPKKPLKGDYDDLDPYDKYSYSNALEIYQEQLTAALAQSFPVVESDCEEVKSKILGYSFDEDYGFWFNKDNTDMQSRLPELENDTLYSLDIEMEEVEQYSWPSDIPPIWNTGHAKGTEHRKEVFHRTAVRLKDNLHLRK